MRSLVRATKLPTSSFGRRSYEHPNFWMTMLQRSHTTVNISGKPKGHGSHDKSLVGSIVLSFKPALSTLNIWPYLHNIDRSSYAGAQKYVAFVYWRPQRKYIYIHGSWPVI